VLLKPAGAETHTHAAAVDRYGFRLGIATWIHRAGKPLSFVQECPLVQHTVPAACKPSRARGLNGKPPRCGFLRRLPVCTLAWLRVPCDGSAWMAPELHFSCGRLLASHRPHTRRTRTLVELGADMLRAKGGCGVGGCWRRALSSTAAILWGTRHCSKPSTSAVTALMQADACHQ
jgi:hypothetical protein